MSFSHSKPIWMLFTVRMSSGIEMMQWSGELIAYVGYGPVASVKCDDLSALHGRQSSSFHRAVEFWSRLPPVGASQPYTFVPSYWSTLHADSAFSQLHLSSTLAHDVKFIYLSFCLILLFCTLFLLFTLLKASVTAHAEHVTSRKLVQFCFEQL